MELIEIFNILLIKEKLSILSIPIVCWLTSRVVPPSHRLTLTIPPAVTTSAGLLVPTSDLEEEWRSESEEDQDGSDQLVSIRLDVEDEVRLVHLQVSRRGVRLVTEPEAVRTVCQTTVPIVFCSQSRYTEKKVPADLALTDVSQLAPVRSLSPVVFTPAETEVSLKRSAAELKRQLTFVETPRETDKSEADCQTERLEVRAVEVQTEQGRVEADSQTEVEAKRDEEAGTQTIPVAMSQAGVQTQPQLAEEELISHTFPACRSPRHELTFSSTQTSPPVSSHMISQTSPPTSSRTRESSPASCRVATAGVSEAAADEMVARVLLEHAGAEPDSDSRQSLTASATSTSSSTISEASGSLFSVESGRATSYDNVTNRQEQGGEDLSRTVNYLDLSRLGNEGETPNSDEIWVTVEDDNKFLTSDTETYSVATDKVNEQS